MIYLKTKEEWKDIMKKERVLVDFYADWCGPCKMLGEVLEEIDQEKEIEIVKVNTDNFMSLARDFKIMTIPNIKIFENGKVVKEQTGFLTKDELLKWIKE